MDFLTSQQLSAEAWQPQQKLSELIDWMFGRVPNHVGAAKLLEAAELLLAKGQHELALRKCFSPVAHAGLLVQGDERWEKAAADKVQGPCLEVDRTRMHVQALFGVARCDIALLLQLDPTVCQRQTLADLLDALERLREATQIALQRDESLYWLVLNGTIHIHQASVPIAAAGHAARVVEFLVFATLCTEAHVLLATPQHLGWRVSIVEETCRCYDDCGLMDASADFISRAFEQIEDLKRLEALDPLPQNPEVAAMYGEAERRLRVLAATRDEDAATVLSRFDDEGHFASAPGDRARFLLEMLRDPKRRDVKHSPPEGRAEVAMAKVKEWATPLCEAMRTFYQHAAATRAASTAAKACAESIMNVDRDDTYRRNSKEDDGLPFSRRISRKGDADTAAFDGSIGEQAEYFSGSAEIPEGEAVPAIVTNAEVEGSDDIESIPTDLAILPPDLDAQMIAAYAAAVAELPLVLHAGLLKRAFGYEAWDTFSLLQGVALLRIADIEATSEPISDDAIELMTASSVLGALNDVEGRGESSTSTGETAEGKAMHTAATAETDPRVSLGEVLSALQSGSERTCADLMTDAALFLLNVSNALSTDTDVDARNEVLIVAALQGSHMAFERVDFHDGELRATVALRLCSLLEHRGEVQRAAAVAADAKLAIERARTGAMRASRGFLDEPTRHITAESVWAPASSGDGGGAASSAIFSHTPSSMSESERRLACVHVDVLSAYYRAAFAVGRVELRERSERRVARVEMVTRKRDDETIIFGVKSAWDHKREARWMTSAETVPHYPAETEERLMSAAADNPWERAALFTEMAANRSTREQSAALLERAAACLRQGEKDERDMLTQAPAAPEDFTTRRAGSPRSTLVPEASERTKELHSLVPAPPTVLSRDSTSVTVVPPELSYFRSAIKGRRRPMAVAYAVLCKEFGVGLSPGMHNVEYPNSGVRYPIGTPFVTISGLTPNRAYAFAVVAYDEFGEVIGGPGLGTGAVVAMQSLPTTPLWSAIAVLAWRLGCAAVARRSAGTVYRRFVEIIRCGESCKTQPMTNLRLRRSVVSNCSPAVLRAASRTILVYADVSLASTQAERPVGDPPIELSVPDTHKQMNRLRVAEKILLAMELATYFDDASLMQEAALRLGNCLAPLLDAAFRPRALFTPIAQCIALLGVSGGARWPSVARLVASLAFELIVLSHAVGEWDVIAAVAALDLDVLRPPLGAPSPELVRLEQFLISLPEWPSLMSAALASRAEAAGTAQADDPVSAVAPKLASEGASAGYDALVALGDEARKNPDFLRAFARIVEMAVTRDGGAHLPAWCEMVINGYKAVSTIAPTAYPELMEQEAAVVLEPEDEDRVAALEAAATEAQDVTKPEPLPADPSDEDSAAYEETMRAWTEAQHVMEAAEGAREAAMERAERRERAARTLTRYLPPLFARRNAVIAARPIIDAGTQWHSAICVSMGLAARAAKEAEGRPLQLDPGQEPVALEPMRHFTRAVELAARVKAHGRLVNATSALYNLMRSPMIGLRADKRLAQDGGARCLHVAAARALEHLKRLQVRGADYGAIVSVDGGEMESPMIVTVSQDMAKSQVRHEVGSLHGVTPSTLPWFAEKSGASVERVVRFVAAAADACASAGYHHRASELMIGLVDLIGTDDIVLDVFPRAMTSIREAETTFAPAEAAAAEARLMRAITARPAQLLALDAARNAAAAMVSPPICTSSIDTVLHDISEKYQRAVSLGKIADDDVTITQALLELGDVCARGGDFAGAISGWAACLDHVTGTFDIVKTSGVCSLPCGGPEACLRAYGFWGCARGAAAAARLHAHGNVDDLSPSHRTSAALIASALSAALFASSLVHESRALDFDPRTSTPAEIWEGVETATGWDLYRFDAETMCHLMLRVGEAIQASGRPLEAFPALKMTEMLAVRETRDVKAAVRARIAQAAALADAGSLAASADILTALIAGDAIPSVAAAADGNLVLHRPKSIPERVDFHSNLPLNTPENHAAVTRIATSVTSEAVATMYGADVTARLALARARWLVAAASTSAEWKSGFVDPITGAALEKVPGESTYPIDSDKEGAGRDDTRASALTAAEMILRDVLTAVESDVIALAEAEHARIAEANAKLEAMLAEHDTAVAAATEAKLVAEEAAATAAATAKFSGIDDTDTTEEGDCTIEAGVDAVEAHTREPAPKTIDYVFERDEEEEGKDAVKEEMEEDCLGGDIPRWLMASPAQLSILVDATRCLSETLRLSRRPKEAFDASSAAAKQLQALAHGTPPGCVAGGLRASAAAESISNAGGVSLWAALHVEAALSAFELGVPTLCRSIAATSRLEMERLGDTDAARRLRRIELGADVAAGDFQTAVRGFDALLDELTRSKSGESANGSPPAPARDIVEAAGAAGELSLRRRALDEAQEFAACASASARAEANALGLIDGLKYPALMNVHIPIVPQLADALTLLGETALARGGIAEASDALDEAAKLCGFATAGTNARLHARIALLRGHIANHITAVSTDADRRAAAVVQAETTLAAAARWAGSPEAGHDRDMLRSIFAELAVAAIPAAVAEIESTGSAGANFARLLTRLGAAASAANKRDVLTAAFGCSALTESVESLEWPRFAIDSANEAEAARDMTRHGGKVEGANASEARRAFATHAKLSAEMVTRKFFVLGTKEVLSRIADMHTALIAGSEAYATEYCVESHCFTRDTLGSRSAPSEAETHGPDPAPGTVAAHWHSPASVPSAFRTSWQEEDAIPVVLSWAIIAEDGRAFAGEACMNLAEVRAAKTLVMAARAKVEAAQARTKTEAEESDASAPILDTLASETILIAARAVAALLEPLTPIDRRTGKPRVTNAGAFNLPSTLDASFLVDLCMFVSSDGGFVRENCGALANFLAYVIERRALMMEESQHTMRCE